MSWHEWKDFDDLGKRFWDSTVRFFTLDDEPWDIDSYDSMKHYSDKPFVGSYATTRMNELYNDELERYYDDMYKYTGQNHKDSRYPILQDRTRSNSEFTLFQVSEAVRNFYTPFAKYLW